MEAIYISSNSFSVEEDKTSEFLQNRRLRLDCGSDGIKYASIISASFTSVTVIIIDEEILTSNLIEVLYSVVKPGVEGNLPDHYHSNIEGDGGYIIPPEDPTYSFLDLTDTPSTYSGTEGMYPQSTGSGVEWVEVSEGGANSFLDLIDTPIFYPIGGEYLSVSILDTGIDEVLTDFPVTLNISEAAGVDAADLTKFFTELAISMDDTFDELNSTKWTNDGFYINDGQLKANLVSSVEADNATLTANYNLSGDFDIQVDVPSIDFNNPSQTAWPYICILQVFFEGETDYFKLDINTARGDTANAQIRINSTTNISYVFAPVSTKMRIVRSGSSITGYFWANNRWEWSGDTGGYTYSSMPTSPANFIIKSQAVYSYINVAYDNFKINSGTVVWPNGYPYRKKIMIKDALGEQLPVEVESWDQENKRVVLHTKVPTIYPAFPTKLSIFYDADLEDNSQYIGDTGEVVAQSVWDSSFTLVNNMGSDPSGGTGCMLDSTSNANNGTPIGTLTSVDTAFGKAVDLDGGAESIQHSGALLADWTIECFIDFDTVTGDPCLFTNGWKYETGKGILVRYDNTEGAWTVYYGNSHLHWTDTALTTGPTYLSFTLDDSDNKITKWEEGLLSGTPQSIGTLSLQDDLIYIGSELGSAKGIGGKYMSFRVSNIVRSAAWIKATNLSVTDQLVTYSFSTGSSEQYLAPNATSTGLIFKDFGDLGSNTFTDLIDTPNTYSDGQYLRTTASGIEAIDGIIMKAPNESEWLIQVTNSGTLYTTAL